MTITTRILIYMVIAVIVGSLINAYAMDISFVKNFIVDGAFYIGGKMFISSLKMLVVPVVFCSLILGIVGMDDMKTLGRTGTKTLVLFLFTTGLAVTVALLISAIFNIGAGFEGNNEMAGAFSTKEAPPFSDVLINIIPSNIIGSMAQDEMLQLIVACIFLGIAMANSGDAGKSVANGIAKLNEVIMVVVNIVMALAPYGVFCLMAKTFSEQGIELIKPMAGYFFTIVAALLIHSTVSYMSLLSLFRINPFKFYRKMRSVQLFAFSTASSNATIPVNLKNAEERLGVDNTTASFIIPFGATINMDGTAIMQGVATVFIANVYGIDLSFIDYLVVIGMSVLASIGTAGVPGVGIVMLAMVFNQVGLPVEGIALIMGVDRLLDMMRTVVNVTGDAVVACCVAKTENKFDQKIFDNPDAGIDEYEFHEYKER